MMQRKTRWISIGLLMIVFGLVGGLAFRELQGENSSGGRLVHEPGEERIDEGASEVRRHGSAMNAAPEGAGETGSDRSLPENSAHPSTELVIRVVDTAGAPLANVPIDILRKLPIERSEDLILRSKSDAEGRLYVRPASAEVLVQVKGEALGLSNDLARVRLRPGGRQEHQAVLLSATARLLVRATTDEGEPIADLEVALQQGLDYRESGRTDAAGELRFDRLFPGVAVLTYEVGALTTPKTAMSGTRSLELLEGENLCRLDARRLGELRLHFVVDGEPAEELALNLAVSTEGSWQPLERASVKPGAFARLFVPAGKYRVNGFLNTAGFMLVSSSKSVEVAESGVTELEFRALAADRETEVEVVGPENQPLRGVKVVVFFPEEGDPLSESGSMATTDEQGRCRVTDLVDRPGRFSIEGFETADAGDAFAHVGRPEAWRFDRLPERFRMRLEPACSAEVSVDSPDPGRYELRIHPHPEGRGGSQRLALGRRPKLLTRLRPGGYLFSLTLGEEVVANRSIQVTPSVVPIRVELKPEK